MNPEIQNNYEQQEQAKNKNDREEALLREYGYKEIDSNGGNYDSEVFSEMIDKDYDKDTIIDIDGKSYKFSIKEEKGISKYEALVEGVPYKEGTVTFIIENVDSNDIMAIRVTGEKVEIAPYGIDGGEDVEDYTEITDPVLKEKIWDKIDRLTAKAAMVTEQQRRQEKIAEIQRKEREKREEELSAAEDLLSLL